MTRNDGIRRIHNDRFIALQAGYDFDRFAVIAARCHRHEFSLAAPDRDNSQTLGAKQKCLNREDERRNPPGYFEMDLGIGARKQLAGGIIDINLGQESASREVDGFRRAHKPPGKLSPWKLGQSERGAKACSGNPRILFRDTDVHTQDLGLRDVEEIGFGVCVAARVD